MPKRLTTWLYFADREGDDTGTACLPEARRPTPVAPGLAEEPPTCRFDIVLCGGETVFFEL